MNTHTPRSRLVRNSRVLRRSEEIIDAAARVFAERGYHGTSTQAIADVLGMRQASLYYYFPSKEAALEIVCIRGTDGFVEGAEAVVESAGAPLDKLARLIAAHLAPDRDQARLRQGVHQRAALPAGRQPAAPRPQDAAHRALLRARDPGRHRRRQHRAAIRMRASPCWRCSACAMPSSTGARRTRARTWASIAAGFAKLIADGLARQRQRSRTGQRSGDASKPATTLRSADELRRTTAPALLVERARHAARRDRLPLQGSSASIASGRGRDYASMVARTAKAFAAQGLQAGERIAIMADACEEWLICDQAAQSLGAIVYGIYPTASAEEVEYQMRDGGAVLFIAEDQEYVDRILPLSSGCRRCAASW